MRTTVRTVLLLGFVGFIALYVAQYSLALAAAPFILVVGALAGLAVAKWLPWAWYGRQFAAGVRAGALACGLSAAGLLLSLVGSGAQSVPAIAARSHAPGIDLSGVATMLGGSGWFTSYLLLTLFCTLTGILLAGIVAQIVGWSKSVRTARVISQAHTAASSLHRSQTWAPASNSAPSVGAYWDSLLPSAGSASSPGMLAAEATAAAERLTAYREPISAAAPSRVRSGRDTSFAHESAQLAPLPPLDFEEPAPLAPLPVVPEPIPPRPSNSGAQPVQFAMTDDLRSALDHWDGAAEPEDEPGAPKKAAASKKGSASSRAKTPAKRQPAASAYLNSAPPAAPRRSRKKQQTRDWLC